MTLVDAAVGELDDPNPVVPALDATSIVVRFGGITALNRVSVRVDAGEIVGLIGANGAGKTTLMDCISGYLQPDEGSISAFGVDLTGLPPELRAYSDVGRSFQDARLFPGLTVEESLLVAVERHRPTRVLAALFGLSRRAEREKLALVDELIDTMGLATYRDKLISELSTGTRRVVDIASILAQRPRLLLLDEPTSGIAQRETEAFGPLMLRVKSRLDCAIVLIEHDMPLIMSLSDRVYAMEAGTVIAEGPPSIVRHDPRVVASYLGTNEAAINRSGAAESASPQGRSQPGVTPRSSSKSKVPPARQ
ncbi:MAG: ABC transporter ATP-binding protein [Acidimicrobiales bacterium]